MKNLLSALILMLTTFLSIALSSDSPAVSIQSIKVDKTSNRALVYLKTSVFGTNVWSIQFSQSTGNQMLSVALTALSTGQSLIINPDGPCDGSSSCTWGYNIKELMINAN